MNKNEHQIKKRILRIWKGSYLITAFQSTKSLLTLNFTERYSLSPWRLSPQKHHSAAVRGTQISLVIFFSTMSKILQILTQLNLISLVFNLKKWLTATNGWKIWRRQRVLKNSPICQKNWKEQQKNLRKNA